MQLPVDDSADFPDVPLKGHICGLRRANKKHYWRVERLIAESNGLPVFEREVDGLLEKLGNSSWFGPKQTPTISKIIGHIERAFAADPSYPIILASDGKIMDGCHRLVGAKLKGIKSLKVVQFEIDPSPDYVENIDE